MNIESVTDVAPTAIAPSPTPGKMYELFPWRGTNLRPAISTGSNGLPDANNARPSLHRYACGAVHSAFDVGFDSAKMIGRSLNDDIARTTSSVNVAGVAATPMIAVGRSA